MIFSQDRGDLRRMYTDAWRKRVAGMPLSPLEVQIADVIELHPEYQATIAAEDIEQEYTPDGGQSNPFLHMGLHLGIREQIGTNRPAGIRKVFESLLARLGDTHTAEHAMIEVLAEALWEAQVQNNAYDEQKYLEKLRRL